MLVQLSAEVKWQKAKQISQTKTNPPGGNVMRQHSAVLDIKPSDSSHLNAACNFSIQKLRGIRSESLHGVCESQRGACLIAMRHVERLCGGTTLEALSSYRRHSETFTHKLSSEVWLERRILLLVQVIQCVCTACITAAIRSTFSLCISVCVCVSVGPWTRPSWWRRPAADAGGSRGGRWAWRCWSCRHQLGRRWAGFRWCCRPSQTPWTGSCWDASSPWRPAARSEPTHTSNISVHYQRSCELVWNN